jgi:hypothetical protein
VPALSLLATLLNPYGIDMWQFIATTVRFDRADIGEWQPLLGSSAQRVYVWAPTLLTLAASAAVSASARTRPSSWAGVAVGVFLAIATFRVSRLAYLTVPALWLIVSPSLARRWPRSEHTMTPRAPSPAAAGLVLIPLIAGAVTLVGVVRPTFACIPIVGTWRPDVTMVNWLKANGAAGRLVTPFDWGEYALWHLGPRLRVSMDGRRETIYSEAMLAVQNALYTGRPSGKAWFARERPEYVWVPAGAAARMSWLSELGYRTDLRTGESFVAVRSDLPRLTQRGSAGPMCFPGP